MSIAQIPLPTEAEIIAALPESSVINGRAYVRSGRVLSVTQSADFSRVEASVSGSARHPYRQDIALSRPNGRLKVTGICTCPIRSNCKHVAAALLSAVTSPPVAGLLLPLERRVRRTQTPTPLVVPAPAQPAVEAPLQEANPLSQALANQPRICYVLAERRRAGARPLLAVSLYAVRPVSPQAYSRSGVRLDAGRPLPPLDRADRIILQALNNPPPEEATNSVDFITTLRRIIGTGRARWESPGGVDLILGPEQVGRLGWSIDDGGTQTPELLLLPRTIGLNLAEPWYVDPRTGEIGPVVLDLPAGLVQHILATPPVPPAGSAEAAAAVHRLVPDQPELAPRILPPVVKLHDPPTPVLHLFAGSLAYNPMDRFYRFGHPDQRSPMALARLSFRYGPVSVPAFVPRTMVLQDGIPYQLRRARAFEAGAADRLEALLLIRVGKIFPQFRNDVVATDLLMVDDDGEDWIDFQLADVPDLVADGWDVSVAADFPYRLAVPDSDISVSFGDLESSGIDWLELDVGVMVDGQRIDLIPALLKMLSNENLDAETLLVKLPDGRLLPLPTARVRPIAEALLDLFARPEGGGRRVGRLDIAAIAALEAASASAGVAMQVGLAAARVLELGRMLRDTDGIPAASVPPSFQADLRPYQARGVDWLQFLRAVGLGAVLADDMGLGKTVQTLAHLLIEQQQGRLTRPALIVCPTSLVANWRMEAERFAPSLRVLALHGPTRKERFGAIADHDLVITTYPLLTRDHHVLTAPEWRIVVLDEAQTVKNPSANASRLVRLLRSDQRLCLSGTPLENHLGELWSLFDFAVPGLLGERDHFRRTYRTPIEKGGDDARRQALARRVRPFLLRRTKQEVERDLPPKTEIAEPVEMGADQRAVYETIRMAMHDRVRAAIAERGLARSGIVILDALLKMRQVCCDPRLLKLTSVKARKPGSAKFERLMEMLPTLLEDGRSILLFSQFTEMLGLIQTALDEQGVPYALLTGDTRDRATPVRRFQAGEVKLFLISLKAGGTGLNLTAADTVIHYDPWWNPAVEDQATDRAHRIGQDKAVFIHKMITLSSIEEKMEVLKSRKRDLAAGILSAEGGSALTLRADDVDELFAPAN